MQINPEDLEDARKRLEAAGQHELAATVRYMQKFGVADDGAPRFARDVYGLTTEFVKGACYENCIKAMAERGPGFGWKLCHGFPIMGKTTSKYHGKRYGHAWIEVDAEAVLDGTSGRLYMRAMYYRRGSIREVDVRRYTHKEMRKLALGTMECGPWHEPKEVGPRISDEDRIWEPLPEDRPAEITPTK